MYLSIYRRLFFFTLAERLSSGMIRSKASQIIQLAMTTSTSTKSSWNTGLIKSMNDPTLLLISSDCAVVIKDKYPKAKHHFLVLAKADIPSIYHVKSKDLELLTEMHLLAINAIEIVQMKVDSFKIGFHAVPSMQRLHLHAVSNDFESPCLKTKKHWNSFNTDLFLNFDYVYKKIKENGSLPRMNKEKIAELSNQGLKCNKCDYETKNMPTLKSHLLSHQ